MNVDGTIIHQVHADRGSLIDATIAALATGLILIIFKSFFNT